MAATPVTPDELIAQFQASLPYPLDPFQVEAIQALASGHSALVAAPTGTGKTVIGEFGVWMARQQGLRAFYTTPIKALSNQKYRDFRARFGNETVGLLTGDVVVNRDAPILVMTTEVLRNMLVQGAPLDDVGATVFDEVHYMGDPERGTAWEEAILLIPRHVPLICLSATVPNAADIAEWIRDAHGNLSCIFHGERAVPLDHRYWLPPLDPASGEFTVSSVVHADGRVSVPSSLRSVGGELAGRVRWGGATTMGFRGDDSVGGEDRPAREIPAPWRVIRYLEQESLTPAIFFVFSRRATEEAARSCLALKPVPHATDLVDEAKRRLADLAPEDRSMRQVALLFHLLPRGVAVHHAGLLPQLKLLVEELFSTGRLRAVFATDTLALGVNMPARTVVVGEMQKYDGVARRLLTPNEYQQMTGRAGRRGIDERGVSVVLYSPWVSFQQTLQVMTGELLPLESAFRPTYSTAVNLWLRPADEERLAELYARSLRRFQHDRVLKELTERKQTLEDQLEREREAGAHRRDLQERSRELAHADYELRSARREATLEARRTVHGLAQVLEHFDYLRDARPTPKATYLRALFDTNALTLCELLTGRDLEGLEPAEVAEALSWFATDRDQPMHGLSLTPRLHRLREAIDHLHGDVLREEEHAQITISRPLPFDFHGVALAWAEGEALADIAMRARLQEGDLVGALQKTLDLVGQIRNAAQRGPLGATLVPVLDEADELLRRGVVESGYRWAVGGVPETSEEDEAESDWAIPLLAEDETPSDFRARLSRQRRRGGTAGPVQPAPPRRGGPTPPAGTRRPRPAGRRRGR